MTEEARFDIHCGEYLEAVGKALWAVDPRTLLAIARAMKDVTKEGGAVWMIGNGGSLALAQHMATDFQLGGVRAIALGDPTAITTAANDNTYDFSFVAQLDALARPGDMLIAISGSGNSMNIVRAAEWAVGNKLKVAAVSGFKGGKLKAVEGALQLHCPVEQMGQAQDAQHILMHMIAYWLIDGGKAE